MKKEYSSPVLEDLGSIRDLTLASQNGNNLDATFPTGTPRGDLTFS